MCRFPNFTSKMRLNARKMKTSRTLNPSRWNGDASSTGTAMGEAVCGAKGKGFLWYAAAVIRETAFRSCYFSLSPILPLALLPSLVYRYQDFQKRKAALPFRTGARSHRSLPGGFQLSQSYDGGTHRADGNGSGFAGQLHGVAIRCPGRNCH